MVARKNSPRVDRVCALVRIFFSMSGHGSGRMFLIIMMLHSGLCRLRLRRAGTWARRGCSA